MKLTTDDLPALEDRAAETILEAVRGRPGEYSPASLIEELEAGPEPIVTYWIGDYPHSTSPAAAALWELIGKDDIRLSDDWRLHPGAA